MINRVSLACAILAAAGAAAATEPAPAPFAAGRPLGAVNGAGDFVPLTGNVKVYGSFRFAESCVFDADRDLLVVMSAGVPEAQAGNDGYVSLVNPDGTVHTAKWIGATRDGLTLNHPLGSALRDGRLYTADIDTVRTFDLETGRPGPAWPLPGATFLNGIAVSDDGTVYVSNTRPESRVYRIAPAGDVSVFVDGAPLAAPNGVAIDADGNVVVVNVDDNAVLTFDPDGKLVATDSAPESGNDGLVILPDGTRYVSSVRYGSVADVTPGKDPKIIAAGIPNAASMCYDPVRRQLVVPMNDNNAVAFIELAN
ncbi:MAG TPA: SMP-30/gluconolactonase/LRE family protein [Woeseiaceae bacterium]|nr:SMP-30/gluconolactonase/LRE family protein [Woeseiaceae bacterium]